MAFRVEGSTYSWTSPFDLEQTGSLFVENENPKGNRLLFKVSKREVNSTLFAFIWDNPIDRPPITVSNLSKLFTVGFYQEGCPLTKKSLETNDSEPFVWPNFKKPFNLHFLFYDSHTG